MIPLRLFLHVCKERNTMERERKDRTRQERKAKLWDGKPRLHMTLERQNFWALPGGVKLLARSYEVTDVATPLTPAAQLSGRLGQGGPATYTALNS